MQTSNNSFPSSLIINLESHTATTRTPQSFSSAQLSISSQFRGWTQIMTKHNRDLNHRGLIHLCHLQLSSRCRLLQRSSQTPRSSKRKFNCSLGHREEESLIQCRPHIVLDSSYALRVLQVAAMFRLMLSLNGKKWTLIMQITLLLEILRSAQSILCQDWWILWTVEKTSTAWDPMTQEVSHHNLPLFSRATLSSKLWILKSRHPSRTRASSAWC